MLYPTKSDHFGLSCPDHDFARQLSYNCSPFAIWARIFWSYQKLHFFERVSNPSCPSSKSMVISGRVLTENGMVGRFERVSAPSGCVFNNIDLFKTALTFTAIFVEIQSVWISVLFPLTLTMGNRDHRMIMAKTRLAGHLVHPDSNFGTVHCSTRRVLKSRA